MTEGEQTFDQPEPGDEVSVLNTTGLLGPTESASVRPARFRRDPASHRAAAADDPVRWHHDLASAPALTAAQAAPLLAVDEDQAGRILGWLRSRGLLLAVRRPDGPAYLRFQFDPVGRCRLTVLRTARVQPTRLVDAPYGASWGADQGESDSGLLTCGQSEPEHSAFTASRRRCRTDQGESDSGHLTGREASPNTLPPRRAGTSNGR